MGGLRGRGAILQDVENAEGVATRVPGVQVVVEPLELVWLRCAVTSGQTTQPALPAACRCVAWQAAGGSRQAA